MSREKDNGRLLHDQIILYGCDPTDTPCYLACFIDGILRSNEAAQSEQERSLKGHEFYPAKPDHEYDE